MAPHSSTLAWKISCMEERGRLQSMGLKRVGHDWVTSLSFFTFHFHALEKEMATHSSVLAWRIPGMGEPGGLPSMGSHRVGHDWIDLAAAAAVLYHTVLCLVAQLCPTLCNPMDCSPPRSSVHEDSSGKNTWVSRHSLLEVIFPTQGLNPGPPHWRWILYCLSH